MKKTIFPGWWQVAIGMLTQATATGTIVTCYSVIAAPLAKEFGASRGELGLVMTLTYMIGALINPMLGTAMDRFSIRKIMLGGGAALAAGYLALSFATSMTGVFVAFGLLLAFANAALGPLSYSTLLPRWFVARRARAFGLTVAGYAIGGLFLPPLFAFMIDSFGWRNAVRLFAAFVILVLIPLIAWLVIDRPSEHGAVRPVARLHGEAGGLVPDLFLCRQSHQQGVIHDLRRPTQSSRRPGRGTSLLHGVERLFSARPYVSGAAHREFSFWHGGGHLAAALELPDCASIRNCECRASLRAHECRHDAVFTRRATPDGRDL
jgi:MFS family permease